MLKDAIRNTKVSKGCLGIFYLGQAGFVFKTSQNRIVYIDPYLSDACERFGFRRLIPSPISADDVIADVVICTHEHPDHLDPDAIPVMAKNLKTKFIGPKKCTAEFRKYGVQEDRIFMIESDKTIKTDGLSITGVYADHGTLSEDAVGILLNSDGISLYHTGDTGYRPERIVESLKIRPDVMLSVINGKFGNLNSGEAAQLSDKVGAKITIGCHFGMFAEHNGDPAEFVKMGKIFSPRTKILVMKPAELYLHVGINARY